MFSMPDVDTVLEFFRAQYPYIPVQVKDEQYAGPAYMPYGHFCMYYELAVDELTADLLSRGVHSPSASQLRAALCHLIADYCEMSNPDWVYPEETVELGKDLPVIDIKRGEDTAARMAYRKLLDIMVRAALRVAPPYNGSKDVAPYFYRGMLEPMGTTTDLWSRQKGSDQK